MTTKEEIHSWLEIIFQKHNLKEISIDIVGSPNKGDSYISDVLFVNLSGITKDQIKKEYDIVLKLSKRNKALRENSLVRESFLNEIHFYNTVLPAFTQFQTDKGIENPFNCVPTCFGTFSGGNMEVVALDNLKNHGYDTSDKKIPLTRKHIDMVIRHYGKWHAISVAMNEQQPEKFMKLASNYQDAWKIFVDKGDMNAVFGSAVDQIYDVLSGDFDEEKLSKWKDFKNQVDFVFEDMIQNVSGIKVITHGDCWSNNFMFKCENGDVPTDAIILDWQLSRFSSPIFDLSYFLFCCISKDDIDDMDTILMEYYNSFSDYLKKLGSNPETLYPVEQFLKEWKQYCKFGIFLFGIVTRLCALDGKDVPDISENAEKGEEYSKSFIVEIKDKVYFKNRVKHLVKYVTDHDLIS